MSKTLWEAMHGEILGYLADNEDRSHRGPIQAADPVHAPSHYQTDGGIECIDAIRAALGREGFIAYCRGNSLKYAWRAGKKGSAAEDMAKAAKYAEWAAKA